MKTFEALDKNTLLRKLRDEREAYKKHAAADRLAERQSIARLDFAIMVLESEPRVLAVLAEDLEDDLK